MSCNICGGYSTLHHCENFDCDVCDECLNECEGNNSKNFCNDYGEYDSCEYADDCEVLKAKIQQEFNENELDIKDKLLEEVIKFFKDQDVTCIETISQTDRVIENAYEFLENIYEIVECKLQ